MNVIDSLPAHRDELVVHGTSVIWSVNDGLVHKRTFSFENDNQPITQALFTVFSRTSPPTHSQRQERSHSIIAAKQPDLSPSEPSSGVPNKALIVVLKTLMHIIYLDGGSYIIHLPFPVLKVWSVSLGLLLERESYTDSTLSHPESQLPRLFTLSGPLEEFGTVTCNRSSLDPSEEILFVSPQSDALCITRKQPENRVTLWHASPDQQAHKRVVPLPSLSFDC
jgi:hypothetical protein